MHRFEPPPVASLPAASTPRAAQRLRRTRVTLIALGAAALVALSPHEGARAVAAAIVAVWAVAIVHDALRRRRDDAPQPRVPGPPLQPDERDPLTGLPNRVWLATNAGSRYGALAVVDLDGFGRLNATHGREAGDRVLRAFAVRLTTAMRLADAAVRHDGDAFVVLLDGVESVGQAGQAVRRLLAEALQPVDLGGGALHVPSASFGVALVGRSEDGGVARAVEVATQRAKRLRPAADPAPLARRGEAPRRLREPESAGAAGHGRG